MDEFPGPSVFLVRDPSSIYQSPPDVGSVTVSPRVNSHTSDELLKARLDGLMLRLSVPLKYPDGGMRGGRGDKEPMIQTNTQAGRDGETDKMEGEAEQSACGIKE